MKAINGNTYIERVFSSKRKGREDKKSAEGHASCGGRRGRVKGYIATILKKEKRIDDTNKRFEKRVKELKQEIEKLKADKMNYKEEG